MERACKWVLNQSWVLTHRNLFKCHFGTFPCFKSVDVDSDSALFLLQRWFDLLEEGLKALFQLGTSGWECLLEVWQYLYTYPNFGLYPSFFPALFQKEQKCLLCWCSQRFKTFSQEFIHLKRKNQVIFISFLTVQKLIYTKTHSQIPYYHFV